MPKPAHSVSLTAPIRALRDRRLLTMAIVAVLYNFGFFTLLAYTPFPLGLGIHQLGLVFFGWGLLLALTSVFAAQPLERRFGLVPTLASRWRRRGRPADRRAVHRRPDVLIGVVIVSGAFLGIVNTVLTEAVMSGRGRAPDRVLGLLVRALHGRGDRALPGRQAGRAHLGGVADARRRGDGVRVRGACCWPSAACWPPSGARAPPGAAARAAAGAGARAGGLARDREPGGAHAEQRARRGARHVGRAERADDPHGRRAAARGPATT